MSALAEGLLLPFSSSMFLVMRATVLTPYTSEQVLEEVDRNTSHSELRSVSGPHHLQNSVCGYQHHFVLR